MTARVRELEKRLDKEPGNLGLRVALAGALHEQGRVREAVELYRSVAIAYRDGGRVQQAIAVCRSILELAPDDVIVRAMLVALGAPPPPRVPAAPVVPSPPVVPAERPSAGDATPLPAPLPHHVADPTTRQQRLATPVPHDAGESTDAGDTSEIETLPGGDGVPTRPRARRQSSVSGLAIAARHITGKLIGDEGEAGAHRGDDAASDEEVTVPREGPESKE